MSGGSFIGALISGFLTDIFGRKSAIQIASVIWLVMYQEADLKAANIVYYQAYWKHSLLRLPEYSHVNCGTFYQRPVCGNMFCTNPCVCWRARTSPSKGSGDGRSAMGHHMGCFDHVLHFLRLVLPYGPCCLQTALGAPDGPCTYTLVRVIIYARISAVVGKERSLG
jgi:hypothetical protein